MSELLVLAAAAALWCPVQPSECKTAAPPVSACPYGVSGDGCTAGQADPNGDNIPGPPAANANSVQHPEFLASYAHRPPWNVAGVDYPVGPGGELVSALDGYGHAAEALASQGCKGPADPGGARGQVECASDRGPNGLTINGFDFTNSGHCLSLYVSRQSGPVTVTNNRFEVNSYTAPDCGGQDKLLYVDDTNTSTANVSYNIFDGGSSPSQKIPSYLLVTGNQGKQQIEYNSFTGIVLRGWSGNNATVVCFCFNYGEGVFGGLDSHGDITLPNPSREATRQDYNAMSSPPSVTKSGGASCIFCIDNGTPGLAYPGLMDVSHNAMIANPRTDGSASFGPAMISALHANNHAGGVTIDDNYADCGRGGTRSNFIALATGGSGRVSGSGNTDLVTGNALPPLGDWNTNYRCP